ncbi:MAG: menaquinone biosynthetic enzyme MqnA/MqnD family protein [Vicinamibacterales bacterium]
MGPRVRVSAVTFLNARPLVYELDRRHDLFAVDYDLPSTCAARLHARDVDLGLIPAIEYLSGDYRLVPDMAIGSDGPILSVAVFTTVPVERVTRLALDTSSRSSAALCRILCARLWHIDPVLVPAAPDLPAMLGEADAALVIGDPALAIDPARAGVEKIDLGSAWRTLTGLPFVYAVWSGRPDALAPAHLAALAAARDAGLAARDEIAQAAAGGDPATAAALAAYLRDNLSYTFDERARAGLERFYELAHAVGHPAAVRPLRFFA